MKNNKAVMTAFPQLSNGDIDNIIAYIQPKVEALLAAAATVFLQFKMAVLIIILGALVL
jgi:mono/diheme cytochrome c family protein